MRAANVVQTEAYPPKAKTRTAKKIFPKRTGKKPNDAAEKMPPKVMPKNAFSPGLTPELTRAAVLAHHIRGYPEAASG